MIFNPIRISRRQRRRQRWRRDKMSSSSVRDAHSRRPCQQPKPRRRVRIRIKLLFIIIIIKWRKEEGGRPLRFLLFSRHCVDGSSSSSVPPRIWKASFSFNVAHSRHTHRHTCCVCVCVCPLSTEVLSIVTVTTSRSRSPCVCGQLGIKTKKWRPSKTRPARREEEASNKKGTFGVGFRRHL